MYMSLWPIHPLFSIRTSYGTELFGTLILSVTSLNVFLEGWGLLKTPLSKKKFRNLGVDLTNHTKTRKQTKECHSFWQISTNVHVSLSRITYCCIGSETLQNLETLSVPKLRRQCGNMWPAITLSNLNIPSHKRDATFYDSAKVHCDLLSLDLDHR